MKWFLLSLVFFLSYRQASAQNVGIGTTTPLAGLHMVSDNGILSKGTLNNGAVIDETDGGSLFMFYPRKGALRAGFLNGSGTTYWSDANIGLYSTALGRNALASGSGSIAIGEQLESSGINTTAIGYGGSALIANSTAISNVGSTARSQFAMALGTFANANTYGSVAIGRQVNAGYIAAGLGQNCYAIGIGESLDFVTTGHYATGNRAFAFGNNDHAVGDRSFAIGNDCAAGADFYNTNAGRYSFAIGNSCVSSGIFSFAIGNNANTNGKQGSMVLGSRIDGVTIPSPGDFHFLAQFAGGYQLQSNNAGTLGVYLNPNTSSWASLCDKTKKENILLMNDEETLEKLAAINYSSWKYIADPDVTNRHYGIMAQDFYASFGKDALGKIGNDTLVNPIDLLGVAYSAIKALDKRTDEIKSLRDENKQLKARLEKLEMILLKKN